MALIPAMTLFLAAMVILLLVVSDDADAQSYTSPHGGFSSSTQLCTLCHTIHEAPGNRLLKEMPESTLCFTCHNGTGSVYNIQVQMDMDPAANAMHPIKVNLPHNPGIYNYTPVTTANLAPPGPYDCSFCHNPHGDSGYGSLLRWPYDTSEYVTYGGGMGNDPYETCWNCHSSSTITSDMTYFLHRYHIKRAKASCAACHYSPHGVANSELVRFNPLYVAGSTSLNSGPTYVDNGDHSGNCTLSCHGVDHNPYSY
ncbi:doubled CXXCH motif [bacterium BMS3Abin01]|nr:doubled CXXCH motif [bacterium BMS3Abin01]